MQVFPLSVSVGIQTVLPIRARNHILLRTEPLRAA